MKFLNDSLAFILNVYPDNIKNNILLYGVDSYKVLIVDNNALNRKKLFERYLQNCSDNYIG